MLRVVVETLDVPTPHAKLIRIYAVSGGRGLRFINASR